MTVPPQDPIPSLQKALSHKLEYVRQRARIILLTLEGQDENTIAESVGVSPRTVLKWQNAWAQDGLWIFPQEVFTDTMPVEDEHDADIDDDEDDEQLPLNVNDEQQEAEFDLMAFKDAPNILPNDSMAEAGRKLMLHNLAQMQHYLPTAIIGEDIEGVHKMRVATRRLRSVLDIFVRYMDTDAYRIVQKRLRQTARRLGGVRDLDVFRGYITQYIETELSGDTEPLLPLFAVFDAQYGKARRRLEKWLNGEKYSNFVLTFSAMLQSGDTQLGEDLHLYEVNQMVPRLIYADLEYVRLHRPFLSQAGPDELHAIRLDLKRLRYALESFAEVLGAEVETVIKALKRQQDHFGELNDMHVAVKLLNDWMKSLAKPDRDAAKAFRHYCQARAEALTAQVPSVWEEFDNQQIRRALAQAVGAL